MIPFSVPRVADYQTGAAVVLTATLPAVVGKKNRLTSIRVGGRGATANTTILVTVAGCVGGTRSYNLAIPAGTGGDISTSNWLEVVFPDPLPATSEGVAIVLTVPSFGAGNNFAFAEINGVLC